MTVQVIESGYLATLIEQMTRQLEIADISNQYIQVLLVLVSISLMISIWRAKNDY